MKTTLITTAILTLLAGASHAQTAVRAEGSTQASATSRSGSIAGQAAMRQTVEMGLPTAHVSSVIAEGRARGATDAQIDRAALAAHSRLRASSEALRGARGSMASHAEIDAGANALASGAEISALASIRQAAPSGRSLTASLQALASLTAQGVASSSAAADIAAMLKAGATDSQLSAVSAIDVRGTAGVPRPGVDAALTGAASAGVGGVTGTANAAAGLGGAVTGTASGAAGLGVGATGAANAGAAGIGGVTGTVNAGAGVVGGL